MVDSSTFRARRVVVFLAVAVLLLVSFLPSKRVPPSALQDPSKGKDAHSIAKAPAAVASKLFGSSKKRQHPIDKLVQNAKDQEEYLLSRQTTGLEAAAKAYRARRGRHPPPRFDRWYKWAMERDVLMIEEFFDPLYDDLEPFWNVSAKLIRDFPRSWSDVLSIRDGKIIHWADEPGNIAQWMDYYDSAWNLLPLEDIPDVDLAFNGQDEPKLFVPWDVKQQHLQSALAAKAANKPTARNKPSATDFVKRDLLPAKRPPPKERTHFEWMDYPWEKNLWHACRETCPPDSKAKKEDDGADLDYTTRIQWPTDLEHLYEGFVANWSSAKSACENPHLRGLHGSFIAMQSQHADHSLEQRALIGSMVPLLSGSKIRDINSEILIPAAVQWPSKFGVEGFNFGDMDTPGGWEAKVNKVVWRGVASGGLNNKDNWTRFQRHRFVAMTNGTLVGEHQQLADGSQSAASKSTGQDSLPHNFPLPNPKIYDLSVLQAPSPASAIKSWLDTVTDTAFTHLRCWPAMSWFTGNGAECPYNKAYYAVGKHMPSAEQLNYRYLPDIDGATFSGRYRAFLLSDSAIIKSTIYDEWHDSRLVPWRHFIPMDNTFQDFWGILQYFFGYENNPEAPARDEVAQEIADGGSKWARTVIRREDMVAYIYRVTLELARLQDERREDMGWADDL